MAETLRNLNTEVTLYFPHELEHKIYDLARVASIDKKEKASRGTICYVKLSQAQIPQWSDYLLTEDYH